MNRLLTIRVSHYNERARWALDHCGVTYREETYMPMMHALPVLMATRGVGRSDRLSTRLSTPVLVTTDGEVVADSSRIVDYAEARRSPGASSLRPARHADDIAEVERLCHDVLGRHGRSFAYYHVFDDPKLFNTIAERNVAAGQATAFAVLRPGITAIIRRGLRMHKSSISKARERVRGVFEEVGRRLVEGGYLVGERFTAADLTFASLASPVLLPTLEQGFGGVLPTLEEVPATWRDLTEELRASVAGRFAHRMYQVHRQGIS